MRYLLEKICKCDEQEKTILIINLIIASLSYSAFFSTAYAARNNFEAIELIKIYLRKVYN